MKKLILGMLVSTFGMSSWGACTYNFDATDAEIKANYGNSMQKFPSLAGQKGGLLIEPTTTNNSQMYQAANSSALTSQLSNPIPPQTGIFAYEYKIKVPAVLLQNGEQILSLNQAKANYAGGVNQITTLYGNHLQGTDMSNEVIFVLGSSNNGATGLIKVPVTSTSDGYQRIGFYINQDTKQMGVIYNGVNKGYISTHPQKIANLSFDMNVSAYGVAATSPNIGNDLSVELITDKNKFSFTYPVGTKDICNN